MIILLLVPMLLGLVQIFNFYIMKINKTYLKSQKGLLLLLLLLTSCEKFVDIKQSTTQRLTESVNDAQLILNNYSQMNVNYPADGELSADNYYLNDPGFVSLTNQTDRDLYVWSLTAIRDGGQWLAPYSVIYYSNLALETADKFKGTTDLSNFQNVRGQALFFRANCFWQLAQIYCKPYSVMGASSDPGVPLRITSDINEKSDRGTLQQTYEKIISDLQEAAVLLPNINGVSSRPNKAAAYALLARVYLSMENYPLALSNANAALEINSQLLDYNTLSLTSATPFARFNKEVLFHSVMVSLPPLNPGSATNNIAKIEPSLYASYNNNDLRKQLFFKANSGTDVGSFRFSGNYDSSTSAALFNGLAVDELFLIRAECYARAGSIVEALSDLNTLLRTRWITGTYNNVTALNAEEALMKILVERRKELIMRGQRWTDLRRLNKDNRFAVTLTRTVNGTTYNLRPNDARYTLLIPEIVISNSGNSIYQNNR